MLPRELFEDAAARINCLNTRRHGQLLHGLIRWLRPQSVVEVGSYTGYTAVWMARALQENARDGAPGKLLCIDDFSLAPEAFHAFWHNVGACGVGDVVSLEPKASAEAEWPAQVDFAFIDGDHSYEACKHDAEKAISLGAKCVALHDVQDWWGPREWFFLEENDPPGGEHGWSSFYVPFDGGLGVLLRDETLPPETFTREAYPLGRIVAYAKAV